MGSLFVCRKLLSVFCLFFLFILSSTSNASVSSAVDWLKAQQQANDQIYSAWTAVDPLKSTTESLLSLTSLNKVNGLQLSSAMAAIALTETNNSTEQLAKLMLIKQGVGAAYSSELSAIVARQVSYSGYGDDVGYEADPLSTAAALDAYARLGLSNPEIGYAVKYLLDTQKADGSWSLENNSSNIALTAQVMKALWGFRHTYAISTSLDKAATYLLAQRGADNLWPELTTSAYALTVLLQHFNDRSTLNASVNSLAAAQLANGSFDQDVYTTALVIYALHLSTLPAPDEITLSGKVIDGQSESPLVGASVEITGVASASQIADSSGAFKFNNIVAGSYTVKVTAQGYGQLSLPTLLLKGSKADLGVLKLTKLTVDPVTGTPVTTGTVRGSITDRRTGSPVAGAVVSIAAINMSATTDVAGDYQISNVPAGNHSLVVNKPGYADVSAVAKLGAQQTLLFSPSLQEMVSLGVMISGAITEHGSEMPLEGASIVVKRNGIVVTSQNSGSNGQYEINGLSAGNISIEVSLDGYRTVSASAEPKDGTHLTFSPQITKVSTPPVVTKGGVGGTVVDAVTGRGVGSVSIAITYEFGSVVLHTTGADGEFLLSDLDAGAITVAFTAPGYQSMQASLSVQGGLVQDFGNIQFHPVSAVTSGKIFGLVADVRTETPVAGAIVSLKNTTTNQLLERVADAGGAFDFPVVPAGTYAITLKATGYAQVDFTSIVVVGDEIDLGRVLMRKPGVDALIPDVAVLAVDRTGLLSDAATFNASGHLNVTLINRGNTGVEVPFSIYAFEDINKNGTYDSGDTLLANQSLEIGQSTPVDVDGTRAVTLDVSGKLSFRDAPVSILLDATNVLLELSEANNVSSTAGLCSNQQKPSVDLALCMDSSGSMSAADFKLQLEGTAQAIETVVPRDGTVRISALQFDSAAKVELNPTIIEEDNIQSVADKIRTIKKSGGGTSIHACIDRATTLISTALPASSMQIIDVSTDGQSTQSLAVDASKRAKTAGIDVLNAIGVGTGVSLPLLNAIVFPQPVGGDRGFVLTAKNYQEYMGSISMKIERETKIADLTLGGAQLIDNGFGVNPDAKVIIGNAGASTITESIIVSLYNNAPENGGQLVATQTIETDLGSGSHLDVTFTNIDSSKLASGKIVLVAKLSGDFPECNSNNNRHELAVASKRGAIDLTLNGSVFAANVEVLLSNSITNSGALSGNYKVSLAIVDSEGFVVQAFASENVPNLLPNQSITLPNRWNTALTASGTYRAIARLYDVDGNLLDSDEEILTISELDGNGQTPDGNPLGRVTSFSDRPQYHINDQVTVGYSVENITQLHTLNNSSIAIQVMSPSGAIVYDNTITYASFLPGQLMQWQQIFKLNQAEAGTYQVIATLRNDQSVVFGTGTNTFVVANNPVLALRGEVSAESPDIDVGNEQKCHFKSINSGSDRLASQSIRYLVVNVDNQSIKSEESVVLNLDSQEQIPYEKTFSTAGYGAGTYACVLEVVREGQSSALAAATFAVKESPVKLVGDIAVGEKSRLLVLMDESSAEKAYLENLLTGAGWFYTIVTKANDFDTQLRTGGYGAYALLSEKITLTPQTRDALKLQVAAGDGLFVAGGHDRRHQSLEDALGVRVHAKQAKIKGLSVDSSALGYAWLHTFDEAFNSMTFDAQGATVIGRYVLSTSQGNGSHQCFGAASDFNVFALENFTSLSSTVEGRIAVGGNLNLQNFSVGDSLDASKLHDVAVVGGNATFPSGRVYYGNFLAGGSVSGVGDAVRYGMAPGAVIRGNSAESVDFAGERDYLQSLSADIGALPANGTAKMKWGGLEFKGDCRSLQQVFSVNANELATAHTFAVSCIPSGATVIFNIPGQSATIQSIGMQSLSNLREKVLFNFPQAKTLTFKSVAIEGSVLAPYAVVEQPAGRVEGQVIVKSWNSTNWGYMSIHNRIFKGDLSALTKSKSTNALAIYQYQQGKTVFASFDMLAQALVLHNKSVGPDANVFAQLLLAALNQVNPEPATARAGKVIPLVVTFENAGNQLATGQALLTLSPNLGMIHAAEFSAVPETTSWSLPFTLSANGQTRKTLYLRLPASGSANIQFKVRTSPDGTIRLERALTLNTH